METYGLINILSQLPAASQRDIETLINAATRLDLSASPYFTVNGIKVYPKEIEIYAYKEGLFEDNSVHRNELQQNNKGHLYVHRFGKTKDSPYKGRAGVDYCFSGEPNLYYTWLIRSAYFEGIGPVYGPSKVREMLLQVYGKGSEMLEKESFDMHLESKISRVLFSERINLGKTVTAQWRSARLRAVIEDESFRSAKYKDKEALVVNYVNNLIQNKEFDKETCIAMGVDILGYMPAALNLKRLS